MHALDKGELGQLPCQIFDLRGGYVLIYDHRPIALTDVVEDLPTIGHGICRETAYTLTRYCGFCVNSM